ncbi:hypothetical protein HHK36_013544 [Tetracentron sinense]|uniref:RAVE complex protein Rav1 C-terminal domain-containing protein n=1 Tax=Tetracentron sinense TaxID=13715 RepID=A0A835DGU5_TETSI|nr:hypothetical protein HHK36_013544 [Tetracentron sinense]
MVLGILSSFCWSQIAVLVQSSKMESIKCTGSGDGIIAAGIEVVLWKKKGKTWEIAWKFRPEQPQTLVSATSDGKSGYVKAVLHHPQPVSMIQWRPSTAAQLRKDIKQSQRDVLLTCYFDGTVRYICSMGNRKNVGMINTSEEAKQHLSTEGLRQDAVGRFPRVTLWKRQEILGLEVGHLHRAVHPSSCEVEVAISLDCKGLLLFWSLSTISRCLLDIPSLVHPTWKLSGKSATQDLSCFKYSSLRWAPSVLNGNWILLMVHDGGIDCFIIKNSEIEEAKMLCHKLCTIPFTGHSHGDGPTNIFAMPLPSDCRKTLISKSFMLLGIWTKKFQALSGKLPYTLRIYQKAAAAAVLTPEVLPTAAYGALKILFLLLETSFGGPGPHLCLFTIGKCYPEFSKDNPLPCMGGTDKDMRSAIFTDCELRHLQHIKELSMATSVKDAKCMLLAKMNMKNDNQLCNLFLTRAQWHYNTGTMIGLWSMLEAAEKLCNWKRVYVAVRHLVGYLTSANASEKGYSSSKSSLIIPQIDLSNYFQSHYRKSDISGFIETLEKFHDLAAITNMEKIKILAVIDLLGEISDSCSPYGILDEPGRRFWVAVRFQRLYFLRRFGRLATMEELVVNSELIGWAFHSDCQENLFGYVLSNEPSWQEMRNFGVGFWFTNATQLRTREEKNKAADLKNAYVLRGRHQLELAIAFFLLGGDPSSAITVCAMNLGDEQLALIICRLLEGLHEWALGNYYQSYLKLLGLQVGSVINKSALSANHAAFLDLDIGQYYLTLATKNSLRNAVGECGAAILARWATLMNATASNRRGISLEALECLSSSPSIIEGKDQDRVSDIGNDGILQRILNPSPRDGFNWLSGDVAFQLESHAKLDLAVQYISKVIMEHPSWSDTNLTPCGALICPKEYETHQYDLLLENSSTS